MHTLLFPSPLADAIGLLAGAAWRQLIETLRHWRRDWRAQTLRRSLAELDERTLRDVGLLRSDLAAVAAELAARIDAQRGR